MLSTEEFNSEIISFSLRSSLSSGEDKRAIIKIKSDKSYNRNKYRVLWECREEEGTGESLERASRAKC